MNQIQKSIITIEKKPVPITADIITPVKITTILFQFTKTFQKLLTRKDDTDLMNDIVTIINFCTQSETEVSDCLKHLQDSLLDLDLRISDD